MILRKESFGNVRGTSSVLGCCGVYDPSGPGGLDVPGGQGGQPG